jgi:aspartate dehydrogenase
MKIGIIGGGAIARLILERVRAGDLGDARVVAILARSSASARGLALAREFGVTLATGREALLAQQPDVVVEAASHEAVREHAEALLRAGIALVVLSGGALFDDALRMKLERAAHAAGALLYVPSGGIAGLDALKAAYLAGVDEVTIAVAKPPAAWKDIPYVLEKGIDLGQITRACTLFEGPAREGVPLFPANVNIAAALSLAGIGFDRTRLKVVADPGLTRNTHFIEIRGASGSISVKVENVPVPDNPKTAWLACYSALAALKLAKSPVRYGT